MLNPSTADANQDDPTIRRCINFAKDWGYGGIYVVNVYAYRATDPRTMGGVRDPQGPEWARWMSEALGAGQPIAAWGNNAGAAGREMSDMLLRQRLPFPPVLCLGITGQGQPRHPLYVRADTAPVSLREALNGR